MAELLRFKGARLAMQTINLDHLPSLLTGHLGLLQSEAGRQPIRVPADELPLYDDFSRATASMSAGVRLRLVTNTRRLRLTTVQMQFFMNSPGQWSSKYDLFIDGKLFQRIEADGGAHVGPGTAPVGEPHAVLDLQNLPAGEKEIELWFPTTAQVSISSIEIDDDSGWRPDPGTEKRIVFHGSSITQGIDVEGASSAWPAVAARLAKAQLLNLGWAGSCLISGLAARIVRDQEADLIVLELGVNVHQDGLLKARTFHSSVHSLLAIIREGHPHTPIVVVSPIYKEDAEASAQGDGLTLVEMRHLLSEAVTVRRDHGDRHIRYLSGLELLGADDRDHLSDGTHPDMAGHAKIGHRFFDGLLKDMA